MHTDLGYYYYKYSIKLFFYIFYWKAVKENWYKLAGYYLRHVHCITILRVLVYVTRARPFMIWGAGVQRKLRKPVYRNWIWKKAPRRNKNQEKPSYYRKRFQGGKVHFEKFLRPPSRSLLVDPYTTISVKHLLFPLCSLSDNWQLLVKQPVKHLTSSPKHLSSGPKHLYMLVRCFGLLVRCLTGCFTSSCQLVQVLGHPLYYFFLP